MTTTQMITYFLLIGVFSFLTHNYKNIPIWYNRFRNAIRFFHLGYRHNLDSKNLDLLQSFFGVCNYLSRDGMNGKSTSWTFTPDQFNKELPQLREGIAGRTNIDIKVHRKCDHSAESTTVLYNSGINVCRHCGELTHIFGRPLAEIMTIRPLSPTSGANGAMNFNVDGKRKFASFILAQPYMRITIETEPNIMAEPPIESLSGGVVVTEAKCNHPAEQHEHIDNIVVCKKCNNVIMRNGIVQWEAEPYVNQ